MRYFLQMIRIVDSQSVQLAIFRLSCRKGFLHLSFTLAFFICLFQGRFNQEGKQTGKLQLNIDQSAVKSNTRGNKIKTIIKLIESRLN